MGKTQQPPASAAAGMPAGCLAGLLAIGGLVAFFAMFWVGAASLGTGDLRPGTTDIPGEHTHRLEPGTHAVYRVITGNVGAGSDDGYSQPKIAVTVRGAEGPPVRLDDGSVLAKIGTIVSAPFDDTGLADLLGTFTINRAGEYTITAEVRDDRPVAAVDDVLLGEPPPLTAGRVLLILGLLAFAIAGFTLPSKLGRISARRSGVVGAP